MGLFGRIGNAVVKNLILVDSYAYLTGHNGGTAGVISYARNSTIQDCSSSATVHCDLATEGVGGIAGDSFHSNILNCTNNGTISCGNHTDGNTNNCGGGRFTGRTLSSCINTGLVTGTSYAEVGGVAGNISDSSDTAIDTLVENCINHGPVKNEDAYAGEVAGQLYSGMGLLAVSHCSNTGIVISNNLGGGLFGNVLSDCTIVSNPNKLVGTISIEDCENSGSVQGADGIHANGGVAAEVRAGKGAFVRFVRCTNSGEVSCSQTVSGIIGSANIDYGGTIELSSCINNGVITTAGREVGGIIGMLIQSKDDEIPGVLKMTDCVNSGSITGVGWGVGGLVGMATLMTTSIDSFLMETCQNEGDILCRSGESMVLIGGVIGTLTGTGGNMRISDCENSGNITLDLGEISDEKAARLESENLRPIIGNIIGQTSTDTEMIDCVATGNITVLGNHFELAYSQGTVGVKTQSQSPEQ